jgi:hypothetical protein
VLQHRITTNKKGEGDEDAMRKIAFEKVLEKITNSLK